MINEKLLVNIKGKKIAQMESETQLGISFISWSIQSGNFRGENKSNSGRHGEIKTKKSYVNG